MVDGSRGVWFHALCLRRSLSVPLLLYLSLSVMAAAAEGWQLWMLKDMRSHACFDGSEESWETWALTFEAEVEAMGWGHLIKLAVESEQPLSMTALNAPSREAGKNLYTMLSMCVKGVPLLR